MIRADVARARVCGACAQIYGPVIIRPGDMVLERVQRCCQGGEGPEREWPWYDFNAAAQICDACGADVVRSGSRWSSYYCAPCKDAVVALNERRRELFLPLGRHSMMNSKFVFMEGQRRRTTSHKLFDCLRFIDTCTEPLTAWRKARVRAVLAAMGKLSTAPVEEFLAFADAHRAPSEEIVAKLERHLVALDAN